MCAHADVSSSDVTPWSDKHLTCEVDGVLAVRLEHDLLLTPTKRTQRRTHVVRHKPAVDSDKRRMSSQLAGCADPEQFGNHDRGRIPLLTM